MVAPNPMKAAKQNSTAIAGEPLKAAAGVKETSVGPCAPPRRRIATSNVSTARYSQTTRTERIFADKSTWR